MAENNNLNIEEFRKRNLVGYTGYSGIEIERLEEGMVVCSMPITEHHLNPLGTVHGGACFTLADSCGGIAVRTLGAKPTTCSSTISFMRPTMGCKKMIATATVLKRGASTCVVDIRLDTDTGVHASQVLATYFNLDKS